MAECDIVVWRAMESYGALWRAEVKREKRIEKREERKKRREKRYCL